ncbi:MAG: PAS domain S-box protein [Candidatus Bathyarchaeia archaeon]
MDVGNELFRSFLQNLRGMVYQVDMNFKPIFIQGAVELLTGYKTDELTSGKIRWDQIIHPDDLAKILGKDIEALRSIPNYSVEREYRIIRRDRHVRWVYENVKNVCDDAGKPVLIQGILYDITERKQAEEALRESEEKYRKQFDEALDAIFLADAETGIIIDCNRAACNLVGREKSKLVGKHQTILHPPQVIEGKFSKTFMQHLKEKEGQILEDQVITKNGEIRDVAIKANVFELGGRKVLQGIFRDITEQKRSEKALKESEENYRAIINGMNDTVWVIGFDGKFIDVNDAAVKVLGYSREELLSGMGPCDIDASLTEEQIKELIKNMPTDEIQVFPTTHITKDKRIIPVEVCSTLVNYKGKRVILSIARDITERKKMEEQLRKYAEHLEELVEERTKKLREAERLAAIGEVAAMVGHDMRNPLTAISGAVYYLKTVLNSKMDVKMKKMFNLVENNIEYLDKIINDLLDYSREIRLELKETSLKSVMKDALTLVKIPRKVRVISLVKDKPKVKVDARKIQRIFVNIIKNAVDAMPKGGKLTIKSRRIGSEVKIAFADTGIGMTKEDIAKLWKPLFTTKAKGIGLGLAICKRIVEAHKGSISLESEVGKGTTVTVVLPIEPKIEKEEGGEKVWVKLPESSLSTMTKA